MASAIKGLSSLLVEAGYCSEKAVTQWLQNATARRTIPETIASLLLNGQDDSHKCSTARQSLAALVSCGVVEHSLLKLLSSSNASSLLMTDSHQINASIGALAKLGFNETERARLVTSCSDIIQSPQKNVSEAYMWMRQTFTDRQARQMVFLRPQVLAVDKETLIDRANYLFARMRVIGREVAYSGSLCHPIERVRCRHIFLLRSGRYEYPDAKARVHRLGKNPSLREMLDTSDRDFVTKVARLTMPEFVLFQKLLLEEDVEDEDDY